MAYDSDSPSHDGHDEDDEDEEDAGGNRLLGFMFGNVDDSGDLDADYLDEDAKEHLAAVADKIGASLKDIDLSVKSLETTLDATDQDYDEKAENAVNYEDIDEQYEGPEVQAATEEDFLMPKKDFFSTAVSVTMENTASVFDDENYDDEDDDTEKKKDEDDDTETQIVAVESKTEAPQLSPADDQKLGHEFVSQAEWVPEDMHMQTPEIESFDAGGPDEDDSDYSEDSMSGNNSSLLPVLCVEDGKAILRFSEIFGIHEPIKKSRKRVPRYVIPKEKFISMDASDTIEEDDETFLKATFQDFPWTTRFHMKSEDAMLDDEGNSVVPAIVSRARKMSLGGDEHRKDSCVSSVPMKDDASVSTFSEGNYLVSPNFYSLDQHDWEEKIIWNNSPLSSENFVENCELSGPDSDSLADKEMDLDARAEGGGSELHTEPHDKDHGYFLNTRAILVEPFGSNENSDSMSVSISENRSHPQLLRLESRSDTNNLNSSIAKDEDAGGEAKLCVDAISRFSQLTLQNRDVLEGSWLDEIVWEPNQSIAKPKLILDLQDEHMLFELSDVKDADNLQLHAGAMIISRSTIPGGGDSLELHGHGLSSAGRFNISNDKFYSNRKVSQQLKSHSKKRAIHGLKVLHSVPALRLQTMKAKLSNKDVANFHRPKALWYPHDIEVPFMEQGQLAMQGPMKIIIKSLGGRGSKLHVDAEETISSVKAKASKKLDFKLVEPVKIFHSGIELEDDKSLAEQSVRPNSVLHLIRTRIHMLPRAQKLPGENKSLRPPGAFKRKADLSVKDGHVFLMEYCEERPLLLGNAGMGARLCTYYQKSVPGDQTGNLLRNENSGLGSVVVLDTADKSPFLGDIKPGTSQSCIETNMYRAPLFQHKVSSTDYLLVRSSKGKLSIRRIDRIHVVGQQEPHMEVMAPGSKNVQFYIMNRLLVHMYREFRASEKRGSPPSIHSDELFAQFPSLSDAFLRKRLKNCADLQKGPNGQFLWVMKRNFRIPSEEELRRMVTPENVCAYESMQAGLYRLKRLGITKLTLPTGLSSAMNQLPDEAIALAAASHIERELQITPWNLSSNFVSCTNQNRENLERLEISGVGDPSGRGLGFSYVRTTPKAPIANSMVKKKTVVAKGSTVTGTDADLRRLSMEAARELLLKFNVPEDQIARQTRWHRIALIRKLSSDQAASGVKVVDSTAVSKFARGQRMSFLQLQQQTREKCQEIWDRQVQSLFNAEGEEENENESDLDSFAGDLENLLDAEEGEENNSESKNDNADGVKGLKMRRRPFQTQAEEEIEDEAAEAAELCRMLMDEEEADRKKKKKGGPVVKNVGVALKSQFGLENADGIKKNNAVAKRVIQPEESFSFRDNIISDQKEDENVFAKKHLPGKLKAKKKNEIENTGMLNKKVKILADGMNVIKEKKSARESFVCGACGQFGHMRTNKNCPRYGFDSETRAESVDLEKPSGKSNFADQADSSQPKPIKKIVPKNPRSTASEVPDDDKPSVKAKTLKVKCGATEKHLDKVTPTTSQNSDRPVMTDGETSNRSAVKVNKIIFSNRVKPDDGPVESHKPSIVIKPPVEGDRDQPRKKIIIKQPKEIAYLDENSQDGSFGFEYRKTKKIIELSSLDSHREDDRLQFFEESSRMRDSESNLWWVEEQRRNAERQQQEERNRRSVKSRMTEEQPKLELLMFEEAIRREREEEEAIRRENAKKKKKRPEIKANYLDDLPPRRNDTRMAEKERPRKRPAVEHGRHAPDYGQASKRRRGGEVGLSNILENIVEMLRGRTEISYLFLKPVSKKEAPDYLDIVRTPMDLSKIRDRARRMEYKNRHEFRHDVYQIVYNAHLYNDQRNPGIPPLADQLLELCDYLLEQHDAELTEVEDGIE